MTDQLPDFVAEEWEAAERSVKYALCLDCGHYTESHDSESNCWGGDGCECDNNRWVAIARSDWAAGLRRQQYGIGAVVRDMDGLEWVHVGENVWRDPRYPHARSAFVTGDCITVTDVLSSGWIGPRSRDGATSAECGRGPCYLGAGHDGPCEPGSLNDPRRGDGGDR